MMMAFNPALHRSQIPSVHIHHPITHQNRILHPIPTLSHPPNAKSTTTQSTSHDTEAELSEKYTEVMSQRMGTVFTYRHEDGMNFNRILDDLIVGSCLQTPQDVDTLSQQENVRTILCLQENSDMDYFFLDIAPIKARCTARSDIKHLRHAIRDFDPYSLRRRLPGAVALLQRNALQNGGTNYIHCTAGLGRAPATALAYMWWVKGIPLDKAYALLTGIRPCKPKAEAIRAAAVDLLYGENLIPVTISMNRRGFAQKVEIAGLDVGWGQTIELTPDTKTRSLVVKRLLPAGKYQFKFIFDGVWGPCLDHLTMMDGDNLNNYIIVPDEDLGEEVALARERIRSPGGELTDDEYERIRRKLSEIEVDGKSENAPTAGSLL